MTPTERALSLGPPGDAGEPITSPVAFSPVAFSPVTAQCSLVALLWVVVTAAGGLGTDISALGAAAAAALALLAGTAGLQVPRSFVPAVAPALLLGGVTTAVMATGPAFRGAAAIAVYVGAALVALGTATRSMAPAAIGLAPALALAARAAPGVTPTLGLAVVVIGVVLAVMLLVGPAVDPQAGSGFGVVVVAVGVGLLPFTGLGPTGLLAVAAGVLVVALDWPVLLLTVAPATALGVDLAVSGAIDGGQRAALGLAAAAFGLTTIAATRRSRSMPDVGLAEGAVAVVAAALVAAPEAWSWAGAIELHAYTTGVARALSGGMLAVVVVTAWRLDARSR